MLVIRWSGFAVPPVLLSLEQLFTDRAGPVLCDFPVSNSAFLLRLLTSIRSLDSPSSLQAEGAVDSSQCGEFDEQRETVLP